MTRYVGKEDEYLELCLQSWVFIWAFGACTLVDYKDKNSNSFLGYHQHWWRLKLEILWSSWQSQKFRHFFFDPEWTDGQFNNFVIFFFFFLPNWLFFLYPLPSTFFFLMTMQTNHTHWLQTRKEFKNLPNFANTLSFRGMSHMLIFTFRSFSESGLVVVNVMRL